MKKTVFVFSLFFLFLSNFVSVAQSLNYTDLNQFWQEFKNGVTGGYGTKILRMSSSKLTNVMISNYVAQWQANRCILRGVMVSEADEFTYNPDTQEYTFTILTPQGGEAIFKFGYNSQGFLRFTNYTTKGNITCPVGTENNTNLYTRQDLIGTWQVIHVDWLGKPDHIRNTYDVEKEKEELEKIIPIAQAQKPLLGIINRITFNNNDMIVETKEWTRKYFWQLSYNQLHIKSQMNEEWKVFDVSWRIDAQRNFNLTWFDYEASDRTSLRWIFIKNN
ncbi:MAG: hypothetical protein NZ551_07085 [Microscillaceae bacterium]|nr:hypothetical protein [Microscillaceae bacterium]MDW8460957.1 hypothetical protein [Cytophagales bacterium]